MSALLAKIVLGLLSQRFSRVWIRHVGVWNRAGVAASKLRRCKGMDGAIKQGSASIASEKASGIQEQV